MTTYNKTNVLDFSNPHIDVLAFVDRQANVEKIVLMGHTANLHEGQQVTFIVTPFILRGLDSKHQHLVSGQYNHLKTTAILIEALHPFLYCTNNYMSSVSQIEMWCVEPL